MQKTRSLSIRTVVLLIVTVLALTLCFTGTARAALAYFSPDYQAEFETTQLDVALTENGTVVEGDGALLGWMENPVPGKTYDEVLAAQNNGEYDQYVRVVVKKYWTDADGNKDVEMNPALIQLMQADGWIIDEDNTTPEQIVLYSTDILGVGQSRNFITQLRIDPVVITDAAAKEVVTKTEDGKTITTTTYALDGYRFNIEAEVDAVQTHNAPDAIKSVWGIDVEL